MRAVAVRCIGFGYNDQIVKRLLLGTMAITFVVLDRKVPDEEQKKNPTKRNPLRVTIGLILF